MACKIIVAGSVDGHFEIFDKLAKLHEKQQFSLGLILGDLFANGPQESGDDQALKLLRGDIHVPFSTYFTAATRALPQHVQQRLDANDVTKTSEGIRLVVVGGTITSTQSLGQDLVDPPPSVTEADIKSLHGANSAHLLVTTPLWPAGIREGSKIAPPADFIDPPCQASIAKLCATLKPTYHFSTSDFFFEREPFNHSPDLVPDASRITRFISMASYGNKLKQKWLYAFSMDTHKMGGSSPLSGITPSPFHSSSAKRQRSSSQHGVFDLSNQERSVVTGHRGSKRYKGRKQPPPGPESCFLCLSNPSLATHLITSIGADSYLTTAKGPLSSSEAPYPLGFPCHMLIIPLSHSPTVTSIMPEETRRASYLEMTKYRQALQKLVASVSQGALGAVTWEISRSLGVHVHWQFLPIPTDLIQKGLVEAALKVEAENERYDSLEVKDIGDGSRQEADFLRVWTWTDRAAGNVPVIPEDQSGQKPSESERSLVLEIGGDAPFDLQFPRKVVAKLLSMEDRSNWRDCTQTPEEETRDAEAFKAAFQAYDFT